MDPETWRGQRDDGVGVLDDPTVRRMLRQAWEDSQPGTSDAHEEGGFVLRALDGSWAVER
jgi:hypothetical protein